MKHKYFPNRSGAYPYYTTETCTDSARLASLPSAIYLNECHPGDDWKKELNKIGYRIAKTNN